MGLMGLSVDTETADRSTESVQRSTLRTQRSVRIKQYSKKEGTVFGLFGQQPPAGSNSAQVDTTTLSPSSSGISSPGSSHQGSPQRRQQRAKSETRRTKRDYGKEQSPGSDYGSLVSDLETGDSSLLKAGESSVLGERVSADEDMPLPRRQRQRSASESISDKLSESQTQRDKDLQDLWPESNSLDRNTSQYGNNAVAVRGAKLQQSDAFQNGCQSNNAVDTSGAKSKEFQRVGDKNAAATISTTLLTSEYNKSRDSAVATTGAKSHTTDNCKYYCQSCKRERQLTSPPVPLPLPFHTQHSYNTPHASSCKPKHPPLLPKSRSFVLPRRPSFTHFRPQQHRESCCIDRVHCTGKQPETYLKHLNNQQNADIKDKSAVNSHEEQFHAGLAQNKCNTSASTNLYSSSCHGDGVAESAGIWTSGSSCHGSSCCLNVVQDVLSRIPIATTTTCKSQQLSSVLDLRTTSTSCNLSALPVLPLEFTPCSAHYVTTSAPPHPHYATMRIRRSTALMGNLPCWKQRHLHDDNEVNTKHPNGNAYGDGHGLVTIRMKPDSQGRFGFNVKGGADQGMPIIVSRVAPNTPADVCIPRLNEGDQVLYINGRDVSQHTHEQVVMFIRASRETHSGELVLVVRPNVYIGEDATDPEPDFVYNPDTHDITSTLPPGSDPLAGSIMLLSESLESGAALAQFEQMYRKKPGLTHNAARASENICKNRYRDISPYDQTRVLLKGQNGDYINANYVNMEIPGSGVVNRYIAAQGPLPNTCRDFWQMIWEQQCRLVVMLTTKVERGRVKCHQYWPDLYETMDYGNLQVTCLKEEQSSSFAFREFTLVNIEDGQEERHIRQMQYLAWPDHGVPDDSSDFLGFVMRVRQNRTGMVEPTVVHCSAGIGRTGVLITMETSMCLMEANQPVYPLDIVRQMRDQRAMLIQTSSQYKFVCEAITRVYHEKIVKPLDDFKR